MGRYDYGHEKRNDGDWRPSGRANLPYLRRRVPRRVFYLIASIVCVVYLFWTHQWPPLSFTIGRTESVAQENKGLRESAVGRCRHLPGADDTVVVMKTGGTELGHKLPIHLNTTLLCYPNKIIFSDYEEDFLDEHIFDALESVNEVTKSQHPDFELWRRLRNGGGRRALEPHELSGQVSKVGTSMGKTDNPGWRLDKWKFLPIVNRTLSEWPNKKWYIFVETDTFIHWQTLLNYLAALDHTRPYYIGGPMWIGDILFAHGGTGFVISKPALESVVSMFRGHQTEWEWFVNDFWAGDGVLGKAMIDSGTRMTHGWPIFQGDGIGSMDWTRNEGGRRLWCSPTASYHHLTPSVVEDLWRWEMDWMAQVDEPQAVLHHHDMYSMYLLPRIQKPRINWDNQCKDDKGPVADLEECRSICQQSRTCLQYSLSIDSRCLVSERPQLGEMAKGVESGWIADRMEQFAKEQEPCPHGEEAWIY
ncbi:hypothetical protein CB0940_01467 [Cercospora beticola]|uniref:N-acetylgalactosaminide beta-1,3-galactosyltransferase n=2 Tax=Cercospora beticola TaxID=122368 RepID=A0A2G5ICD5_CERBT|nr:hypothetical protein CB0940_01467 [Cercospora beticola]PIB02421.1 hypothetical protein CB0940_01467 [Cercospora beticola]CAK1354717.1 unnamed protein product [Cercospora beticola]